MFENFCIIEKIKTGINSGLPANYYFWRTYEQKEIDLIEEKEGNLYTYEFKWSVNEKERKSTIREFQEAYPGSTHMLVNPNNIEEFLLK